MGKKVFSASLLLSIAMSFAIAFAGPNVKPGKWEITTTTEMTGMPMSIPPVTHTQCLKGGDFVPQTGGENQECNVSDVKVSGDTVSWKLVCSGKSGHMEGTGKTTYSGETMQGEMHMVIQGAGIEVSNKISGKRIGECD